MADSNDPRSHRAYDAPRRSGVEDARGDGDPLAELARLIGQSDPFADFERNRSGAEAQGGGRPATAAMPLPDPPAAPVSHAPYPEAQGGAAAYAPSHPHTEEAVPPADAYPDQGGPYAQYPQQAYGYPADSSQPAPELYYDPYYDPESQALDEAEYYDEQHRRRRRRRLAAVVAILSLAVVGGAGAYGYRTFFGPLVHASPPPVIKAEPGPTKVIPASQAGDSASNKLIYDRVGEHNQAEKVVPREEKPIDIKTATVTPPRIVYPSPDDAVAAPPPPTIPVTRPNPGGQVLPVASAPSLATQGSGAILPSAKRVRTVTIRPDMTEVPSPGSNGPAPRAEPAMPRGAPPPPSALAQQSAAPPPPPTPAPPTSAPRVAPAPRQTASAPLSLSPGAVSPPAAAPRAPAPARAATPSSQGPLALGVPPPAVANTPRTSADGSFMVQVSSQRSESDAKASYRTLQARYPNVLGGRSSFVRRADLGGKGVYYRTMVGPFTTGEQAAQFCGSLKAAGGQCIIHRN